MPKNVGVKIWGNDFAWSLGTGVIQFGPLGWDGSFLKNPLGGVYIQHLRDRKKKHTIWTLGSLNRAPFLGRIKLDANVEYFFRDFSFFVHEVWVGKSSADPCLVRHLPFQSSMGWKIFFRGILSQKYASWNLGVRYRRFIQNHGAPFMTCLFEGQPPPPPRKRGGNFLSKQGGSIWVLGTYNTYVMVVPSHIGYVRGDHLGRWPKWDLNFYPRKRGISWWIARHKTIDDFLVWKLQHQSWLTNLLHKHMLFDSVLPNTESHSEMRNLPTPSDICWKGRLTCKFSLRKILTYPPWN